MQEINSRGAAAGYDLSNLTPLLRPRRMDERGLLRPALNDGLLRFSAELSYTAYTMEVEPWLQAGWRDVTVQVDGELTGGLEPEEAMPAKPLRGLSKLLDNLRLNRARKQLKKQGPIKEMLGAVQQLKTSSTGKAVVMLHPTQDGRYVVAIGFTGTGKRLYDWFSNFRLTAENGFHQGFLQLAKQFEGNEDAISFPDTAAALGLEKLTLRHILEECKSPDSRFILWTAGHSQGGAIMQVWAHTKLTEDGVLPHNLVGCGFASPSTVTGTAVQHPEALPLYHVVNSDDAIPRMGAMLHLGKVLVYPAGEGLRSVCYRWPMTPEAVIGRMAARPILAGMRDTPSCMVTLYACLSLLSAQPVEDTVEMLGLLQTNAITRKLFSMADNRVGSMLDEGMKRCSDAYRSMTGRALPMQRVQRTIAVMQDAARKVGLRTLLSGLAQLSGFAHTLASEEGANMGAYSYIAACGGQQLMPAVWLGGERPALIFSDGHMPLIAAHTGRRVRRIRAVPHRNVSRNDRR